MMIDKIKVKIGTGNALQHYKFFMSTNENETRDDDGFLYETGINESATGFRFPDIRELFLWLNDDSRYLREVVRLANHDTNKIILCERMDLREVSTWEFLYNTGADIHANDGYSLRWAAQHELLDVVKFLVEHGADVLYNDEIARFSSKPGGDVYNYLFDVASLSINTIM